MLRADSGFCRPRHLAWCERHGVGYILGLAKNPRLASLAEPWLADAKAGFAETGEKQRRFGEFRYAAKTWSAERRVIARVEHDRLGTNPRYVVTNLVGPPWLRKLAYVVPISLRYPRSEGTTNRVECRTLIFATRY